MRVVVLAPFLLIMAACSTPRLNSSPSLHFIPKDHPDLTAGQNTPATTQSELDEQIAKIDTLTHSYDSRRVAVEAEQTGIDSTMIAMAAGLATAAFLKSTPNNIGGIALGVATLGQYQKYYDRDALGSAYITATSDLSCISTNARKMRDRDPTALSLAEAGLKNALVNALPDQLPDTAEQQAISGAKSAQTAAQTESEAFEDSPATVAFSANAVIDFINKKNHRGAVAGADIASAIAQNAQTAATSAAAKESAQNQTTSAAVTSANQVKLRLSAFVAAQKLDALSKAAKTTHAADLVSALNDLASPPAGEANGHTDALINWTQQVLQAVPNPLYSSITTDITKCVGNLSG